MVAYVTPCPAHGWRSITAVQLPVYVGTTGPMATSCTCLIVYEVVSSNSSAPREPEMEKPRKPVPYYRRFERKKWGRG